ncbi:cytochrome P450 [Amycolatopsis mediterranei S699]|uniref:Cytochrome P450 n=2 Tax=Amycolatopsis mediterranei TaxID=33910 RepID=A0A0H3D2Q8_AMYMU|nr:cytochrome P450 [Amycolatopsis mediterranei]ADJ44501.1 cytochrome P450 [Amycolatopsis mediterranei U32]AEK41240.1 cytochrome P450 [Amycolatopsis mediterranei S699]AFO76214.1 cytochrome P450 [Amycolatopsis mediterranei S699]AGT83343.1 cytochrome P450 [Amycolatopsis mediterranei RB]KDO07141.1 cytochrome P450 [Amycolatopsis mediterranei]
MTTTMADTWGLHEAQFWLRGKQPEKRVEFAAELGMWNVYGHPEIETILRDPAAFSSDTTRLVPKELMPDPDYDMSTGSILQLDPPLHNKMRKLVSRAFTPKVVADLEPRIAAITRELLDAIPAGDRLELVEHLAYPLPVIVIAELLGVPAGDRNLFKGWVDKMFESANQVSLVKKDDKQDAAILASLEGQKALAGYLGGHVDERRKQPREDLLTKLVEAELDGERLSRSDVVNFANILLLAGHITTTMLLGNAVLCLDTHREWDERVRADRSLVPPMIEESLRYLTPFAAVARTTVREADIGGVTVPADQVLLLWVAAANRDERVFRDPDTFDPLRAENPHLAFGRGIHFCIGAPLARLEGRVALDILFDRYPTLRTIPGEPPKFQVNPNMTGVRELPLTTK